MKTTLKSQDFGELVKEYSYPLTSGANHHVQECVIKLDYKGIASTIHELSIDNICLFFRDQYQDHDFIIEVEHDFPFFKMQFEMEGYSCYTSKNIDSRDLIISSGKHQIFFFPHVKGSLLYPKDKNRKTLEIIIKLDYIKKLFGSNLHELGSLGIAINKNIPAIYSNDCMSITPKMYDLIIQLQNCMYEGICRKIFIENKVIELMLLQLQQVAVLDSAKTGFIKRVDIEKFYYIEEVIRNNPYADYSLNSLAELGGLNNFKLKKGFKEIFGKTVFEHITSIRMENAKQLLLDGRNSISEVSYISGYKNPQHFTAAFKRQFGYLPKVFKSNSYGE